MQVTHVVLKNVLALKGLATRMHRSTAMRVFVWV